MKFCEQCGTTLSILDPTSAGLCTACSQNLAPINTEHAEKIQHTKDLYSATLSYKDGKILLTSREGWLLWSCRDDDQTSLQMIIDRAERIFNIRKRKKK